MQYADGVLFVSENPSQALHKVSEIYDRIAFAAVGRYNEFENLRIAGVRLADMRGYSYDRRDVTGRGLANAYAQTLGTIFSSGGEKPYEVELFVAEIGDDAADDQIYRLTYDGQVADVQRYGVMGGAADVVAGYLEERYAEGASLEDARPPRRRRPRPHRGGRPGHPRRGPRGRGPRPHPQPAAQVPPDHADAACGQLLGERGPTEPNPESEAEHIGRPGRRAEGPPSPSPDRRVRRRRPPIAPPELSLRRRPDRSAALQRPSSVRDTRSTGVSAPRHDRQVDGQGRGVRDGAVGELEGAGDVGVHAQVVAEPELAEGDVVEALLPQAPGAGRR